jgi:putative ABC transport system permease protein
MFLLKQKRVDKMFRVAVEMLMGDKTKYIGLLIGITFTAFLMTFALSYFAGFMTRGFALISENPSADVWVMDSAVSSTEATINMSSSALTQVKSVQGVSNAMPLYMGDVTARYANGAFQTFQMIGVDDATLSGAPKNKRGMRNDALRLPQSVLVDAGGTSTKLQTPKLREDMWRFDGAHLMAPTRELQFGDEMLVDDKRVIVRGVTQTLPRFPPRPLIYTTISNFKRLTPSQNKRLTFVMVKAKKGISAQALANKITRQTAFKAITSQEFKKETVLWYLTNSEDVGDMLSMVILAMLVGFGVTGVMLYMFTYENLKQYALLKAMGASNRQLRTMVFTQVFIGVIVGSGIGIGICAIIGELISGIEYPFRMMWFSPVVGFFGVLIVSITAGIISVREVMKLEPAVVFLAR